MDSLPPSVTVAPRVRPLSLLESLGSGLGQVMFQKDVRTGAVFFLALCLASPLAGGLALVGTMAATVAGIALKRDDAVRLGLYGFNGALVGLALGTAFAPSAVLWAGTCVAAAASSLVADALGRLARTWGGSALTAPFVLCTWATVLAARAFPALDAARASAPGGGALVEALGPETFLRGLFAGVSQVFLVDDAWAGAVCVLGLAIASRRAALLALLGSGGGAAVAWALGADPSALAHGLHGFNPALTAVALGATGVATREYRLPVILTGIVLTAIATGAFSIALRPFGLGAFTAPFIAVTWIFTLARPGAVAD